MSAAEITTSRRFTPADWREKGRVPFIALWSKQGANGRFQSGKSAREYLADRAYWDDIIAQGLAHFLLFPNNRKQPGSAAPDCTVYLAVSRQAEGTNLVEPTNVAAYLGVTPTTDANDDLPY